jgi:5-methylcytosine-specific restriction endonuclease McrA
MGKRHCIVCKVVKPFSEFHKNKRTKEGVSNKCKVCQNLASNERYQEKGAMLRSQMAAQRVNNYQYRLEIERASRARRKEAQRPLKNARQQIRNRLIQGKVFVLYPKELQKFYKLPCFRCGTIESLSIDHVIPLARGGNHSIGNLMTLCRSCNASKGKKFLTEWKRDTMKVAGK